MKVKLDENLLQSARDVLVEAGHEVDTVTDEGLTGAALSGQAASTQPQVG